MAGSWSKEEERLLLQLRSEATVNEELSGTSADAIAYDTILQKLHEHGIEKTKSQMLNKLKYIKRKFGQRDSLLGQQQHCTGRLTATLANDAYGGGGSLPAHILLFPSESVLD